MTNREIEQIVTTIFEQYIQRGNSHKQLLNIIREEGITFKEVPFTSTSFVGALTCSNNGRWYIMVNTSIDNAGRRNFTIAHEMGHYFLKHQLQSNSFYCNDDAIAEETQATNTLEREANHFASCFLMPEQKIKSAFKSMLKNSKKAKDKNFLFVKKDYTYSIWCGISEDLTKRYGVSEAALRYRLKCLKLVEFGF
jgi:Zn-dependent peptidase ImmA (M78 family)